MSAPPATRADVAFDLSRNEIPHGVPPGVRAAVRAELDRLARYPEPLARELCAAVAEHLGVAETEVFAGHGSSGALTTALRLVSWPGADVVFATPSFTGYDALVRAAGARPRPVPGRPGAWQPLAAMGAAIDADTVAVIVTSPHNPSGEAVRADALAAFLEQVPAAVLVVLDEAYLDFDQDYQRADILALVAAHPNLVVTRSFSKAHGLAALRVGYGVGHPRLMRRLRATLVAYDVGTLGSVAAVASLGYPDELAGRVARVRAVRTELVAVARAAGFAAPDPYGNFVWLPTADSVALTSAFAANGVAVCDYPGLGVRITATTPASVAAVAEVLDRFARRGR
ncbi:pyridoxal phosphate-dependent aminotransferase [Nocardia sp. NPDC003482]